MKNEEIKTTQDFPAPDAGTKLHQMIGFWLEAFYLERNRRKMNPSKIAILERLFEEEVTAIIISKLNDEDFQSALEKSLARLTDH